MTNQVFLFVFARWQQQFAIACSGWKRDPRISPYPGVKNPHLTQCVGGAENAGLENDELRLKQPQTSSTSDCHKITRSCRSCAR